MTGGKMGGGRDGPPTFVLHILHQQRWDIASSPFGRELGRLGLVHRFFVAPISLRYRSKAELFARIYPKLLWNTLRLGFASLVLARPAPSAILVSTEIEALVTGLLRRLLRRRALTVQQTLIITPRSSPTLNRLYLAYWRLIVSGIDLGICHARAEIDTYAKLFPKAAGKFTYVPFGTTVAWDGVTANPRADGLPVIVTAGRSGRDYGTLAQAVQGLPCVLRIICDIPGPVADVPQSDQVELLTRCFDADYLHVLASATIVVVPLAVDDISAGQMVFLQASALGRPVVMTRTATTTDYATDGHDTLLVPRGDVGAMRAAILRLLDDPVLAARLGAAARQRFDAQHSTEAYVRNLTAAIAARVAV